MARDSLSTQAVRHSDKRCSYVVLVENGRELRDLAGYLSSLGVAGCDVVILDPAPRPQFEMSARVLRWVGRHVGVRSEYRSGSAIDLARAAAAAATNEKVIVATDDVRYTPEAVARICDLLDGHEVVEPQDYFDPLPWWGGVDAGGILMHRGIEAQPDHGATFGFRRSAVRGLRGLTTIEVHDDPVRRLGTVGAEVFPAASVFVRRKPSALEEWWMKRPRVAGDDFVLPIKTAFFFSLLPLMLLLSVLGGIRVAMAYSGLIAFSALALAIRGRVGASAFFPFHTCLFAPLWIFERSVSVYWALFRKIRGTDAAAPAVQLDSCPSSSSSPRTGSPVMRM